MNPQVTPLSAEQKRQILSAISGEVELPKVSRQYVLGLLFTACAVLLLPLLYLSLIVLISGGVIALIRNADWIFVEWGPMASRLAIGISTLLGTMLVSGLLKPWLAKAGAVKRPRILRRDAEPLLVAYVERLCDLLGAPRPSAIHISCDLNAAAELHRSWFNIFGDRRISLHLGLPLVAGLSLQQFTGVLAHELGHFTQRTAMWLENTVRHTNHWFLQAAYERDSIDEWLLRQCTVRSPLAIIGYVGRAIVWFVRWIILGFALAGTTISCLMSREMEYNADRCQVRVVGFRSMASTLRRLRELGFAHQISFRDIAAFYGEGRLPDDIIALSLANVSFITPKVKTELRRMMTEEVTGLFDSHPSDRDRIQSAIEDGSLGIFRPGPLVGDLPASVLFGHFREISKVITEQYYRDALNQKISAKMLHPVEKLLERQGEEIDAAKALKRYFQTDIPLLRPLPIAPQSSETPENPTEVVSELKVCRVRMMEELRTYQRLVPRYRAAEETLFETIAAQTLIQARVNFEPKDFHLSDSNVDAVTEKLARAREGIANLAGKMLPFETEAGNRLSFALQLIHVHDVSERIHRGDDLWYEIKDLLPEAQYVSRLIGELPLLRLVFHRLMILWERSHSGKPTERVLKLILSQMESLRSRLISIQQEMGNHLYPFDHAQAEMTLRVYALPQIPDEHDLGGLVQVTELMQSRLISIQARLFARLARAAEKVEEAIGMPPLPEPNDDDDENDESGN
jgi:Zn-dependent protease with chaperone function